MANAVTLEKPSGVATLDVDGMSCASCVAHVKKAAESVPGVVACDVNLAGGSAVIRLKGAGDVSQVAQAITHSGYPAHVRDDEVDRAAAETARLAKNERPVD